MRREVACRRTGRDLIAFSIFYSLFICRCEELVRNPLGPIGSDAQAPRRSVAATLRSKVRICRDTGRFSKRRLREVLMVAHIGVDLTCGIFCQLIKFSIVIEMTLGNRRRYDRSTLPVCGNAMVSFTDSPDALLLGLQLTTHRCPLASLLLQLVTALSWHRAGTHSPALPCSADRTNRPSRCGR